MKITRRQALGSAFLASLFNLMRTNAKAEDHTSHHDHHKHHQMKETKKFSPPETTDESWKTPTSNPYYPRTVDPNNTYPPGLPGKDYQPVIVPDGATLPFKIRDGVKVFHLVAEEVDHEFAPGLKARCWGYNGRVHGPVIEAVEGDRVRIYVTNQLKVPTSVHWHGVILPFGQDGVAGLTQRPINPGETFKYEWTFTQHGTLMYHSHKDGMVQKGMGLMGMIVIHPRNPAAPPPDKDYVLLLSEWDIKAGTYRPDVSVPVGFNTLTINARSFPGTSPLLARLGDHVRVRIGNLSAMSHHSIHLHGHTFQITETDGGVIPLAARWPETTVIVATGQTRNIEFTADNPGDWAMHCHMSHHTMNQMGHGIPNMLGVNSDPLSREFKAILPEFMAMGTDGMGEMGKHVKHMATPENSIPMVGMDGPYDYISMGGMFTVLKVRQDLKDNNDPGWYSPPRQTMVKPATPDELSADKIIPGKV